jgi:ATP-dependent RNA helicase RhlE
VQIERELIKMI